jgi:hypothetical protein
MSTSDSTEQQTLNRKSDVHESTCQKGMMNKTYQEDVKDKAYTENVNVGGTEGGFNQDQKVTLPFHAPTDTVNTAYRCLSCTDEGQNPKSKTYLTKEAVEEYRQMEDHIRVEGSEERHVDENPIERDRQTTHRKETKMFNQTYQGDV